jgi:hypothetical protein
LNPLDSSIAVLGLLRSILQTLNANHLQTVNANHTNETMEIR